MFSPSWDYPLKTPTTLCYILEAVKYRKAKKMIKDSDDMETCKTCYFFKPVKDDVGRCRINAPVASDLGAGLWPLVETHDSCGEWTLAQFDEPWLPGEQA